MLLLFFVTLLRISSAFTASTTLNRVPIARKSLGAPQSLHGTAGDDGAAGDDDAAAPTKSYISTIRLRGPVDEGYGRGGKKLGFPTANLPASLFSDVLAPVPAGVYMGFALIEQSPSEVEKAGEKKGRGITHKAVVNVGYSPTFEGEENPEKIVEAHLIVEEGDIDGDFYGETMRLGLYGFLRPEMKFPSFPDLIEAITDDVATAKESLDSDMYTSCKGDDGAFFDKDSKWVGQDGGDDHASYEFEVITQ